MNLLDDPEIRFAVRTVAEGMEIGRRVQKELLGKALSKEDRSPVTVADFAIQILTAARLQQAFPTDPLVAEESSELLRRPEGRPVLEQILRFLPAPLAQEEPARLCDLIDYGHGEPGARFWTLDPVDGTKGFLRGDQYALALALIEGAKVKLGVLGCPNLAASGEEDPTHVGTLFLASRGKGAWAARAEGEFHWQALHVSRRTRPEEIRMIRSYEASHTHVDHMKFLYEKLGLRHPSRLMDSQAKYGVLASGQAEILVYLSSSAARDRQIKIWDQAVGCLLVEEAGGRVTDVEGAPLDFGAGKVLANNRGVTATNGCVHPQTLEALRAIQQGPFKKN